MWGSYPPPRKGSNMFTADNLKIMVYYSTVKMQFYRSDRTFIPVKIDPSEAFELAEKWFKKSVDEPLRFVPFAAGEHCIGWVVYQMEKELS